ncbi:MAG: DUF354 domain-containing protein [Promethearchaeota archaeon]
MTMDAKKIWIDLEEPKAPIQYQHLFKWLEKDNVNVLVTARDFDSTFDILDNLKVDYIPVGKHGGGTLIGKLEAFIDRINQLFQHVKKFNPDYLITFGSPEAIRIAFGLGIPSIGFNDEPRSAAVGRLTLPLITKVITPKCIPEEEYYKLGATKDKLIRYNGIDEIGWLEDFKPDDSILNSLTLQKGKYVLIRSEMTTAEYLLKKMKPEETNIVEFLPRIHEKFPDLDYIILLRTKEQEKWLKNKLPELTTKKNIIIKRFIPNITNVCFYSALVISGGGTIVRESSLLNVPSIEFFPGPSAPQEQFLINNEFPLWHLRNPDDVAVKAIEILSEGLHEKRFSKNFRKKIAHFDNPTKILYQEVMKDLKE